MNIEIRGVERLSFRERQVVALKEMGYSTDRIAKQLALSASTVNTLFSRAKAKGYEVVIIISGNSLALFGVDDDDSDSGGERVD